MKKIILEIYDELYEENEPLFEIKVLVENGLYDIERSISYDDGKTFSVDNLKSNLSFEDLDDELTEEIKTYITDYYEQISLEDILNYLEENYE